MEEWSAPQMPVLRKALVFSISIFGGVFALIVILVDHIPGCILETLTLKNFGFSDAAEVFVFLSGVSVGLAYLPRFQQGGFRAVLNGCWTRAFRLYLVHIALTAAALLVLVIVVENANPIASPERVSRFATSEGLSQFLKSPIPSLRDVALLRYHPAATILPLYVTLMLWAPFALALALWDMRLALLISAGIYAAGRGPRLALEPRFELAGWYFNPLTWQLVFTIGLVCAILWRDGLPRPSPRLLRLSAAVVLAAAIISTSTIGNFTALHSAAVAHLDITKADLGLVRLVHFLGADPI